LRHAPERRILPQLPIEDGKENQRVNDGHWLMLLLRALLYLLVVGTVQHCAVNYFGVFLL
jgi:hypothetical protein